MNTDRNKTHAPRKSKIQMDWKQSYKAKIYGIPFDITSYLSFYVREIDDEKGSLA